jgi:hypothetical protein
MVASVYEGERSLGIVTSWELGTSDRADAWMVYRYDDPEDSEGICLGEALTAEQVVAAIRRFLASVEAPS